jgi:hypothetical protein
MVILQESQTVMAINDDKTLGFTVELYANYMDSVKVSFLNLFYSVYCFLSESVTRKCFFSAEHVFTTYTKTCEVRGCTESVAESKTTESRRGE